MIWTFKQERNCCTISVCYSGCEMAPRRNSFARRQPPIRPVLDAPFLLMQRSGTHALFVKLTGSHLPALSVLLRAYCIVYGRKNQVAINIFLLIPKPGIPAGLKPERRAPPAVPRRPPRAIRPETTRGRSQTAHFPRRHIHAGPETRKTRPQIRCPSYACSRFLFSL